MDNLSDSEIKQLIKQKYEEILYRPADNIGLNYHFSLIKEKKIKISNLDDILKNSQEYQILQANIKNKLPEPTKIFVSCFNNVTDQGGVFLLDGDSLNPLYEERGCYGLYFEQNYKILFAVTRHSEQIIAFRIMEERFERIPVILKNYLFSQDAHGIWIQGNKLFLVASNGDINTQKSTNDDGPDNFVGKIIISAVNFETDHIEISDSTAYNPFNCTHHHHINDICNFNDNFYLSSFSYCEKTNEYKKQGLISRIDFNGNYQMIIDELEHPHSITCYRNKIYLCSSSSSKILSFDLNNNVLKLEYRGPDTFIRGLLPTDNFFYFGISATMGRTDSKTHNEACALLRLDRKTGETKKFSVPSYCNNIYSIVSDTIHDTNT